MPFDEVTKKVVGRLILARHGHSHKNVEGRHGGVGSGLTENGRLQVSSLVSKLKGQALRPVRILRVKRQQCVETAEIVSHNMNNPTVCDLTFQPFDLGILSGLTEAECSRLYPELAARMAQYRAGMIEIAEVSIPGASDAEAFYRAAKLALNELTNDLKLGDVVVIGTRSVLVGLLNVALGRSPVMGGGYCEIPWDNCGYCVLDEKLTTVYSDGVVV